MQINFYNKFNRENFASNKLIFSPFFKNTLINNEFYPNTFYLDDFITPSNFLKFKDFFIFHNFNLLNDIDESYESLKFLNHFYNSSNKSSLNINNIYFQPYSYLFIFDSFRSDYQGFS